MFSGQRLVYLDMLLVKDRMVIGPSRSSASPEMSSHFIVIRLTKESFAPPQQLSLLWNHQKSVDGTITCGFIWNRTAADKNKKQRTASEVRTPSHVNS